jgi:hypothetical protein
MNDQFSDCEIRYCEQRSPEWHALRAGLLTASDFGPWLLKTDKTSVKARESAICRIIAGAGGLWTPPNYETPAMARGTALEPQAIASFEAWHGETVIPVGFCKSTKGLFGCSPDGLLESGAGVESKVPLPATHIAYRRAGVLPEEYFFQVHGSMAVTGATRWWFQSWNPDLAPLRILVERTEFTDDLHTALRMFSADLQKAMDDEIAAWKDSQPNTATELSAA